MSLLWAPLHCTCGGIGASERLIEWLADCPGLLLSLQIELRTVWQALPSMANEEDDPVIQEVTTFVNSLLHHRP